MSEKIWIAIFTALILIAYTGIAIRIAQAETMELKIKCLELEIGKDKCQQIFKEE